MEPSLQKLYADLMAGKSVKAILSACLRDECAQLRHSLFTYPGFHSVLHAAQEELNKPTLSDHAAILNALLKLSQLPATLLRQLLEEFLILFPIYQPLVHFSSNQESPFATFAQMILEQVCWGDDYWQAAECYALFYPQLSADAQEKHKKRYLVALANASDDQTFCHFLKLLPYFMQALTNDEVKSMCAFLLHHFNQKALLAREQIIFTLGLCLSRLPALEASSVFNFLSLQLTHATAKDRIQIAAFSALMQNIAHLKARESLERLLLLWLTKNNLAFQVAACEQLPQLMTLPLKNPQREALFNQLYQALSCQDVTLWAASFNAFIQASQAFGEKFTQIYLERALSLYKIMSAQQKELFIAALAHLAVPENLGEKLGEIVKDYAETHDAPWLYPAIALFHRPNNQYTRYWKEQFKHQTESRKIADCQLFQAMYPSMGSISFLTVLGVLKAELIAKASSALVVCIAQTLAACQGRLSPQQCNECIALLLPHLPDPEVQEAITDTLVTLLAGSEPPARYQTMAMLHRIGTPHTLLGFLKIHDLPKSFPLEPAQPLSPRQRYG